MKLGDKKGKVIVIEGPDGSGKATHSELLHKRLVEEGIQCKLLSFPNYYSDSSALVKRFNRGHFQNMYGADNMPYIKQMSMFYAVDRIATMVKRDLQLKLSNIELLDLGFNMLCNRYTTANMLHMSANLSDRDRIIEYLDWLKDVEYNHLALPVPDKVIYLDAEPETSLANFKRRYGKDEEKMCAQNINENMAHLTKLHDVKDIIIDHCGWTPIKCTDPLRKEHLLPKEEIHAMIYKEVIDVLY